MTITRLRWHVYQDPAQLVAATVEHIVAIAARTSATKGVFRIVLAGGSTPREIYRALAERDCDWSTWEVFFSDERCVPVDHRDRNDAMARTELLDRVPIPTASIHAIPAELGAERGAETYRRLLADVGEFDLTLLGLGEDGHTASLFPGRTLGAEADSPDALAIEAAPKPPPMRVSLSAARLSQSANVIVLATGAGKQAAVRNLHDGADTPLRSVTPRDGIDVVIDAAAAIPELSPRG